MNKLYFYFSHRVVYMNYVLDHLHNRAIALTDWWQDTWKPWSLWSYNASVTLRELFDGPIGIFGSSFNLVVSTWFNMNILDLLFNGSVLLSVQNIRVLEHLSTAEPGHLPCLSGKGTVARYIHINPISGEEKSPQLIERHSKWRHGTCL